MTYRSLLKSALKSALLPSDRNSAGERVEGTPPSAAIFYAVAAPNGGPW